MEIVCFINDRLGVITGTDTGEIRAALALQVLMVRQNVLGSLYQQDCIATQIIESSNSCMVL